MNRQAPQQGQGPTVGDTLTVIHRVAVPPGALVQPRGPTDSTLATLVGTPELVREGDSVRIAYTIAVWSPGRHRLTIPGAVVVEGNGRIDTLPDATVTLQVASVLPERVSAESIVPRDARPWVARSDVSLLPFVVLLVPVALLVAGATLWWRRRGPVVAEVGPPAVDPGAHAARLDAWLAAGEVALVVDHLAALLPRDDVTEPWRARMRRDRFDPDARDELGTLAREGLDLLRHQRS